MPTAFLRSPADSLAGVTAKDKLRQKKAPRRGLLMQEDSDQDFGYAEGRTGPQRRAPNADPNRDLQTKGVKPQDTTVGTVARDEERQDNAGGTAPMGAKERRPMSDGEVQSSVHKMVWDAIEYIDQEQSPFRALASKYYMGELFGNEVEGRSQIVMTVVRDTILMMMPSLMRIFWGAERAVEYGPTTMQQIEMAEQVTEYVWDVVVAQDNRGYLCFYEWFKDALLKRLGIMKYWYDDSEETRPFHNTFVTDDQLTLLQQDPTIRIDALSATEGAPPGAVLFDVDYTQTKKDGRIRFITLPPEEYIFTRGARTTASDHSQPGVALFVGHRTELTRSQLLEIGVDEETIEEWAFKDVSLDHNQEEIQRQAIVKPDTSAIGPIATQKALYIEGFPYLDVDGDGVAELRRVVMLGPSYHVIENEPANNRPFAVICPDPEPHTIIGQGAGDWTMDLQRIMSAVMRAINDSLALTLNPRIGYVEGDANMADVMNQEVGAPIRMRTPGAIQPIEHTFVGQAGLLVIGKLEEILEARTGTTKASAGLDADALQSTTKAAVAATVSSAQAHIEMIARNFAEMGVAPLFRGILQLLTEHQPAERLVKMRGEYVPMDPRSWDANLEVKVKVAIGAGLDDEKYAALAEASTKMEGIFSTMGLNNPIVGPKQYRDTLVAMLKLRGRMDAEKYYKDVDPNWQPTPQPAQDPNMVIAQAEQAKAQAHIQKQQADVQLDAQKHQVETMRKGEDLELKRQEMMMVDQREREKMAMELALEEKKLYLEHQRSVNEAQLSKEVEIRKAEIAAEAQKHARKIELTRKDG